MNVLEPSGKSAELRPGAIPSHSPLKLHPYCVPPAVQSNAHRGLRVQALPVIRRAPRGHQAVEEQEACKPS